MKQRADVIIPENMAPPPEKHEVEIAWILARHYNFIVEFLKPTDSYKSKTPDVVMNGVMWEFKSPMSSSKKYAVRYPFKIALKQSRNVVMDGRRSKLDDKYLQHQIQIEIAKHSKVGRVCSSRNQIKSLSFNASQANIERRKGRATLTSSQRSIPRNYMQTLLASVLFCSPDCYHTSMPDVLAITRFGNPILRKPSKKLTAKEILSSDIQDLIVNMRHTLIERKYGVGIAAPQAGKNVALSVIGIKPTPNRPELEPFDSVLINPEILETFGEPINVWEGCVSCGTDDDILFGQLLRFEKIRVRWLDENAHMREEVVDGFVAQVVQHETDHLNGVLFVDHVTDPSTYMMADEYRKRVLKKS